MFENTVGESSRSEVMLRYFLGDVCLFRLRFQAIVAHRPFDPEGPPSSSVCENVKLPGNVDVFVDNGRRIVGHLPTIRRTPMGIVYVRNQRTTHYIDLRGTFEQYLKEFSAKRRGNLQRQIRKLSEMSGGNLECRAFRGLASVDEYHALARNIAKKTYQEKLFGGAIPASVEFVDKLRERARYDLYRGFVLLANGVPISYVHLPIDETRVVDYQYLGYDPQYAQWSPGTVLLYLALKHLFSERAFRFLNLSYGEGQMKKVFGRGSFLQADVYLFRPTLRNLLAVYTHAITDKLSSKLGGLLEDLGLRRRIRRLLRRVPRAGIST